MFLLRVTFHTLGCKANQADTAYMAALLRERGHTVAEGGEPCEAVVINTCAVTSEAARKSGQAIRAVKNRNPGAVIAVCGCLKDASGGVSVPGVDLLGGAGDRAGFILALERLVSGQAADYTPAATNQWESQGFAEAHEGRARAYLKIQDGCRNSCAYCIIPKTRGTARSMPPDEALRAAGRLASEGYAEIVLTGIEISSYDHGLAELAGKLCQAFPGARFRLGSLEPTLIIPETVNALKELPNLCPHFHLSLQSGCDATLRRMNRRYDTQRFAESIDLLRDAFGAPAITTDLICGFPGETEDEWADTARFIKDAAFAGIHVFPYSRRPGTAAAAMPGQLTAAVKRGRAREAAAIGRETARAFRERRVGETLQVLIETIAGGLAHGHSAEYIPVSAAFDAPPTRGAVAGVVITGFGEDGATLEGQAV